MKARLLHTVLVQPPALGKDVRVKGFVVFVIRIDVHRDVVCIRLVSGHPLLVAPAIDSREAVEIPGRGSTDLRKAGLALSTMKPETGLKVLDTEPPGVNGLEWRCW